MSEIERPKVDTALGREPIVFRASLGGSVYRIRQIRGREALSQPFRFEVRFLTDAGELLDPDKIAGQSAALLVERAEVQVRRIPGVVTEAWISATATGAPELCAVVESKLALLRLSSNCRVFRNMTVPEIVAKVLDEKQFGCDLRLRGSYEKRPYCVQFRETDLDFIHRLLEDEGIFYACQDTPEKPQGKYEHVLLLGDGPWAYEPIAGEHEVPWRSASEMHRSEESVTEIHVRSALTTGKVTLRDWNLEKPSMPMDVSAAVDRGAAQSSWYDFPGKYELPEQGKRKAQLVAEALACEHHVVRGQSDVARFACGKTFALCDGPAALDGEYVLVSLEHSWQKAADADAVAESKLSLGFSALPADITYRPPRVTPSPTIAAPLTGFVTGPEGADIHTDEFGRVKVRFPWDRWQAADDNVSHWIPVLQENTGTSSAIPRVGWEVLCDFIEGDPDRPYVIGRVYNGIDRFPEPLPENKTKTALRSLSSPGRDGQNQIWIDDKGGSELVAIQAEKDQNVFAANDKKEDVLNTEANTVVDDEIISIGANNTVKVGDAYSLDVKGSQTIEVAGSRTRKVADTEQVVVKGARATKIGGAHIRKIGGFDNVAAKSIGEKVGGVDLEVALKSNKLAAAVFDALTVGGAVLELAGQGKDEDTKMLRVETIGAILFSGLKEVFTLAVGTKRSTTVGATLLAQAIDVSITAAAALKGKVTGVADYGAVEKVVVSSGGSNVTITKEGISMESDQTITIAADGAADLLSGKASLTHG